MKIRCRVHCQALFLAGAIVGCEAEYPALSSGVLSVGDVDVPYIMEGRGYPTLVTCDAVLAQRSFSAELRDHLQFVFTEPRMFVEGVDSVSLATMTMDTVAQDYERLRAQLGLERVAVVGHSICGLFALEYARAYPEHVSHVIMIGTPPAWNSSAITISREYWREHASDERKAAHERNRETFTPDSLARLSPQAARWASWLREQPWYFFDFEFDPMPLVEGTYYPIEGEGHLIGSVLPEYEFPSAEEIVTPVFLALGLHDYVVPPPVWDGVREGLENLTTVVFDRSGHFPHLEEQDLFDERLLEWFSTR